MLGKWASQQASEIKRTLALIQEPCVKAACGCYSLPSSIDDFLQPIGEELQFEYEYVTDPIVRVHCPVLRVSTKAFLAWGQRIKEEHALAEELV